MNISPLGLVLLYLLGSFPTGYLIARAHGVDIYAHGSGNVGATNVGRILGKRAGVITLLCDAMKGVCGVLLAPFLGVSAAIAAPLLVCGHCFSLPKLLTGGRLKGGKGVATGIGVTLMIAPWPGLIALAIFLVLYRVTKIVSLAALIATLCTPVLALFLELPEATVFALMAIALIITARHHQNIRRLIEGKEPTTTVK